MTKTITILILSFFSTFSFGQTKEIENFINQAYQQIVPSNYAYYNLVDSSYATEFDKYSLEQDELNQILKDNPDFPINYFLQNGNEINILNWNNYHLEKAQVYSLKSIPKFAGQIRINHLVPFKTPKQKLDSLEKAKNYNEVIVPVKSSWGDKRKNKEIKKAWIKYSNSIRTEDKIYFTFSTPFFSDTKLYAIVALNYSSGGAKYIFKKVDNKWTEIFMFGRWMP
jgi:hypothetical protein